MASAIECLFSPCPVTNTDLQKFKETGIKTIISCSKIKGEKIHERLEHILNSEDHETIIWSHKSCYCTYSSKSRNTTQKSKKRKSSCPPVGERVTKSQVPAFSREDFKTKCFLCTKECKRKDPKNPQRWKKIQWSVCEKESKNPHDTGFKERILDICDIRQDDWSNEVFLHM